MAAINVNAASVTNGLTLTGNNGANILTGTGFDDTLTGNAGRDKLIGGGGSDILSGGNGNDILIWDPADASSVGGGAGTDRLRIDGEGVVVDLTAVPDDVITDIEVISLTGGNSTLSWGYRRAALSSTKHVGGGQQQGE
jgi:Ca2+-binding RTX toxin-like protein